MKQIFFLFILLISFQFAVFAQNNSDCSIFSVEEPSLPAIPFKDVQFSVRFDKNFDVSHLKFLWTVSSGKIVKGQGTSSITLKTDEPGNGLTATIQLNGLPHGCNNTASGSAAPWDPPTSVLVDKYSKISSDEELKRLEDFAKQLDNNPTAIALITKTFPRGFGKSKSNSTLQKTLRNLENLRLDLSRYFFKIEYDKKEMTSLLLIPAGAIFWEDKSKILSAKDLKEKLKK